MEPKKNGYLSILRQKSFSLYFIGQIASSLSDGLYMTVVIFFALELGATPFELGVIGFCGIFPRILLGPIGGVFADRWNRVKTMVFTFWGRSFIMLLIPILFFYGLLNVWLIAGISFLITSASPFFLPASKAFIPEIVKENQLNLANGLLSTSIWPAYFLGAGLAGPLQISLGISNVFIVNAVCLALSAVLYMFLKSTSSTKNQSNKSNKNPVPVLKSLLQGYQAMKAENALHGIIMTYSIYIFFWRGLLQVGLPLYVSLQFGERGIAIFGVYMALNGIGEMVSSLVVGKMKLQRPLTFAYLGEAIFGFSMLGIVFTDSIWLIGAFIFLSGLAIPITDVPTLSEIQKKIPSHHVAKIFSYWNTMGAIGSSLGTLLLGSLFNFVEVSFGFILGGIALILLGSIGSFIVYKGSENIKNELNKEKKQGFESLK